MKRASLQRGDVRCQSPGGVGSSPHGGSLIQEGWWQATFRGVDQLSMLETAFSLGERSYK